MKKSERQIFIMKLDTVGECAIKKHSGIKKKRCVTIISLMKPIEILTKAIKKKKEVAR